jgi:hypothetical protein
MRLRGIARKLKVNGTLWARRILLGAIRKLIKWDSIWSIVGLPWTMLLLYLAAVGTSQE